MTELYYLPSSVLLALVMVSSLCVAAQAMAAAAYLTHDKPSVTHSLEGAVELGILAHCLLLALGVSQVQNDTHILAIAPLGGQALSYGVFAVLALVAGVACCWRRSLLLFPAIPAAAVTLPWADSIWGRWFPVVFGGALLFWTVRAVYVYCRRRRTLVREVSALSVKEAMDALRTGLLYCGDRGDIYLINRRMQELMLALTGKIWHNGLDFGVALLAGNTRINPESALLDGQMVYRLKDDTAWLFTRSEITISGKAYTQMAAIDVSERWALTCELWQREAELRQRGDELAAALETLEEMRRGEELLLLKSKVHDTMAQRLTVLMQVLRAEKDIDDEDLIRYADHMLIAVQEETEQSPHGTAALLKMYAAIGVAVTLTGTLPQKAALAAFCTDFIREGLANAVRHGFASKVLIDCRQTECGLVLTVTNSGFTPTGDIAEGGGITELRRKAALLGGRLTVAVQPVFCLTAEIPDK